MSNDNAAIYYESGQTAYPLELATTTDNVIYSASFAPFSARAGFEAKVMPVGLENGAKITPAAGNNAIAVGNAAVVMPHVSGADASGRVTITGDTLTLTRATSSNTHIVHSIIVTSAGDFDSLAGTQGTAFGARGAAGGAPLIPVDAIEVGQVHLVGTVAAPVVANDIKQVAGLHQELSDFPIYTIDETFGEVHFADALPLIHVGNTAKRVYVEGYAPLFAEQPTTRDWVPAERSHTVSSETFYGAVLGSTSSSLSQASFTARLKDGQTDNIVGVVNDKVWIKFKQDKNRLPYQLTQGVLGLARTYPADGAVNGAFTVSAERATVNFNS